MFQDFKHSVRGSVFWNQIDMPSLSSSRSMPPSHGHRFLTPKYKNIFILKKLKWLQIRICKDKSSGKGCCHICRPIVVCHCKSTIPWMATLQTLTKNMPNFDDDHPQQLLSICEMVFVWVTRSPLYRAEVSGVVATIKPAQLFWPSWCALSPPAPLCVTGLTLRKPSFSTSSSSFSTSHHARCKLQR